MSRKRDSDDEARKKQCTRMIQAMIEFEAASVYLRDCIELTDAKDTPITADAFQSLRSAHATTVYVLEMTREIIKTARDPPQLPYEILLLIFDFLFDSRPGSTFIKNAKNEMSVHTPSYCDEYPGFWTPGNEMRPVHSIRLVCKEWSRLADRCIGRVSLPSAHQPALAALDTATKKWSPTILYFSQRTNAMIAKLKEMSKQRMIDAVSAYLRDRPNICIIFPPAYIVPSLSPNLIVRSTDNQSVIRTRKGRVYVYHLKDISPEILSATDVVFLQGYEDRCSAYVDLFDSVDSWKAEFRGCDFHSRAFRVFQRVGRKHPVTLRYTPFRGKSFHLPAEWGPEKYAHGSTLIVEAHSRVEAEATYEFIQDKRILIPFTHVRIHCASNHVEVDIRPQICFGHRCLDDPASIDRPT